MEENVEHGRIKACHRPQHIVVAAEPTFGPALRWPHAAPTPRVSQGAHSIRVAQMAQTSGVKHVGKQR